MEIGDGLHDALLFSQIDPYDRKCIERPLANRDVRWCLQPLVSDVRLDIFPYNCFITFGDPSGLTADELNRAESTYQRVRGLYRA